MKINNLEMEIKKSFYNKTKVLEDGITHKVDTSIDYPVYQFGLAKNYFKEDKIEVIEDIQNDLQTVINELEKLKENYKKDEKER